MGTAFNQVRGAAVGQPAVLITLVRTLRSVGDELYRRRLDSPPAVDALRSQLDSIEESIAGVDLVVADRAAVRGSFDGIEWREHPGGA